MLPSGYKTILPGSLCMKSFGIEPGTVTGHSVTPRPDLPHPPPGVWNGTHRLSNWPQQGFSHPFTFPFSVFFLFMFPLFLHSVTVFVLYALIRALPVLFLHLVFYGAHSPTLCLKFHVYFNTLLRAQNRHIYWCVTEEKSYHIPSYSRLSQNAISPWNLTDCSLKKMLHSIFEK